MYPLGCQVLWNAWSRNSALAFLQLLGECAETLKIKLKLPQRESEILFAKESLTGFILTHFMTWE